MNLKDSNIMFVLTIDNGPKQDIKLYHGSFYMKV